MPLGMLGIGGTSDRGVTTSSDDWDVDVNGGDEEE